MNGPPDQATMEKMDQSVHLWFKRAGFDYDKFSERRWAIHRAHANVTLEQYRCRLLHRFGQIVSGKLIVYLDLKYWINLRKVVLGQQVDPAYVHLFDILRDAVERGVVVCPLSFWVFEELVKQKDLKTRQATAQLIDRLSSGVAFMHHGEIVSQEVLHFIRTIAPLYKSVKQWPIRECIWTRTFSFLGDRIPVWPDTIPQADQLLVQKNMEDFHFFIPFEDLINEATMIPPHSITSAYEVAEMNRRKAQVRKEHSSFKSMFLAEVTHSIKENEEHFYSSMAYLAHLETGAPEEKIDPESLSELQKRPWRNLIWWLFKKNRVGDQLPCYHIPAALYAAYSWDTGRQLTENDVLDFYHAQIAIPYSDVFLTESSLKHLVCSQHLRLNEIYNTEVISSPENAARYLEKRTTGSKGVSILQELFAGDTYARAN
jgi:hypothetical protein